MIKEQFFWDIVSPLNLLVFFLIFLSVLAIVLLTLGSGFADEDIHDHNILMNSTARCLYPETFMVDSLIDYVAILAWPVIWEFTIGVRIIEIYPFTFLGFIWPMMLGFMDLYFAQDKISASSTQSIGCSSNSKGCGRGTNTSLSGDGRVVCPTTAAPLTFGNIQVDATAVITVAFAMGALLLSLHDKATSAISAPMIMFALLFTIIFVIPSNDIHLNPSLKLYLFSAQRIFLNFAIGFVIAGISVNLSSIFHHHEFYSYKQLVGNDTAQKMGKGKSKNKPPQKEDDPFLHPPSLRFGTTSVTNGGSISAAAVGAEAIGRIGL